MWRTTSHGPSVANGPESRVQVRKFIGIGTLERMNTMLEEEKELADMVVGEGESMAEPEM